MAPCRMVSIVIVECEPFTAMPGESLHWCQVKGIGYSRVAANTGANRRMTVIYPSWPGSSGPSPTARAATDGRDEPGHDEGVTTLAQPLMPANAHSHRSHG